MIRTTTRRRGVDDAGLTLVEVVMYLSLSVIVGTIVLFTLINTVKGEQSVTSVTRATTDGQLAAQRIEKALRSATAVTTHSYVDADNGTVTTLSMVTTTGEQCQAWRVVTYPPSSGKIGELRRATGVGFATWTTVLRRIEPVEVDLDGAGGNPPVALAAFAQDGDILRYAFAIDTEAAPVVFRGGVTPRNAGGDLGATC